MPHAEVMVLFYSEPSAALPVALKPLPLHVLAVISPFKHFEPLNNLRKMQEENKSDMHNNVYRSIIISNNDISKSTKYPKVEKVLRKV